MKTTETTKALFGYKVEFIYGENMSDYGKHPYFQNKLKAVNEALDNIKFPEGFVDNITSPKKEITA